jgi:hypothetical protein
MLLALMMIVSSPTPALKTSIPPLPVRVSLPAPATKIADNSSSLSVSSAGDINGDGLDDLIVGAYQADPSGKSDAGKSYVIFGKTDTDAVDLSKLGDESNG